jgi:hypothetical protein
MPLPCRALGAAPLETGDTSCSGARDTLGAGSLSGMKCVRGRWSGGGLTRSRPALTRSAGDEGLGRTSEIFGGGTDAGVYGPARDDSAVGTEVEWSHIRLLEREPAPAPANAEPMLVPSSAYRVSSGVG